MEALGLIETRGLLAAIEASDVMLKTAEVRLSTIEYVGGGLVTVIVIGGIGAIKTAVSAANSAVERLGTDLLFSEHVIARPDESLMQAKIVQTTYSKPADELLIEPEKNAVDVLVEPIEECVTDSNDEESKDAEKLQPVEELAPEISEASLEMLSESELKEVLSAMKIVGLRKLAKKRPHFSIANKDIYKVNKEKLIESLTDSFTKNWSKEESNDGR